MHPDGGSRSRAARIAAIVHCTTARRRRDPASKGPLQIGAKVTGDYHTESGAAVPRGGAAHQAEGARPDPATHHLSLSLAPAEKVDDLSTSPISSRQKLKLLMVHM